MKKLFTIALMLMVVMAAIAQEQITEDVHLSGKVYCRVDAKFGEAKKGDLETFREEAQWHILYTKSSKNLKFWIACRGKQVNVREWHINAKLYKKYTTNTKTGAKLQTYICMVNDEQDVTVVNSDNGYFVFIPPRPDDPKLIIEDVHLQGKVYRLVNGEAGGKTKAEDLERLPEGAVWHIQYIESSKVLKFWIDCNGKQSHRREWRTYTRLYKKNATNTKTGAKLQTYICMDDDKQDVTVVDSGEGFFVFYPPKQEAQKSPSSNKSKYSNVEKNKHLTVLGIPITGNIATFQQKLLAKNYHINAKSNKELPVGQREYKGRFSGHDCSLRVYYFPDDKTVYKVRISIDFAYESTADNAYKEIKRNLLRKYKNSDTKTKRTDGHESLHALIIDDEDDILGFIDMIVFEGDDTCERVLVVGYSDMDGSIKEEKKHTDDL